MTVNFQRRQWRKYLKPENGWLLSWPRFMALQAKLNMRRIKDPANVPILATLTRKEREEFALRSQTRVVYLGEEARESRRLEEEAALRAAPKGYDLSELNGLNVGCGGRIVSPYLTPVDIMREAQGKTGEHKVLTQSALLAAPDNLPFKEGSLDLIIALHMLEHVADPVAMLRYWLTLLKPGGGIGIVVPDWRYAWDARFDKSVFGHKWNPTPGLVMELYDRHLRPHCALEHFQTYDYKQSFDFVLRKPGSFEPFSLDAFDGQKSGAQLAAEGLFLHAD